MLLEDVGQQLLAPRFVLGVGGEVVAALGEGAGVAAGVFAGVGGVGKPEGAG